MRSSICVREGCFDEASSGIKVRHSGVINRVLACKRCGKVTIQVIEGCRTCTRLNAFDGEGMVESCMCPADNADNPMVYQFVAGTYGAMFVEVNNLRTESILKFATCHGTGYGQMTRIVTEGGNACVGQNADCIRYIEVRRCCTRKRD
jgi:hypothetical protein